VLVVTVQNPVANAGLEPTSVKDNRAPECERRTVYLWTPATGLSDPNIANPIATPSRSDNSHRYQSQCDCCTDVKLSVTACVAIGLAMSDR